VEGFKCLSAIGAFVTSTSMYSYGNEISHITLLRERHISHMPYALRVNR